MRSNVDSERNRSLYVKALSLAILNTLAHEFNTIPHPVQVRIYYKHQTAVGHTLRQQSIEAKCQLLVTCGHQAMVAFPKGPDDGVLPNVMLV